jgi:hypothetical protein
MTSAAIVLINLGLAILIVIAIGVDFAPVWLGGGLLVAGVLAAIGAVRLWRGYLDALQA